MDYMRIQTLKVISYLRRDWRRTGGIVLMVALLVLQLMTELIARSLVILGNRWIRRRSLRVEKCLIPGMRKDKALSWRPTAWCRDHLDFPSPADSPFGGIGAPAPRYYPHLMAS